MTLSNWAHEHPQLPSPHHYWLKLCFRSVCVTIAGNLNRNQTSKISLVSMKLKSAPARHLGFLVSIAAVVCGSLSFASTSRAAQQQKELTAEQIAEATIIFAGSGAGRALLAQIRKNGLERGRETRTTADGKSEEVRYELRFIHGEKPEKDKVRVDSKTAQAEYALVYGEGRLFGIINGATFTPRADTAAEFIAQQAHSIDALLRYKELESKLSSAGKDKQQGVELYVIDL